MKIAPHPPNEVGRLAALSRLGILDTPPDTILDNITRTASEVCGTSVALISFIDSTRQWFKSNIGMAVQQTPRDLAFCTHAILEPNDLMEIEDASLDERFCNNPLVTRHPNIRFYAGKPLVTPDGFALGTLCVIDSKSLRLSRMQRNALKRLAQVVIDLLNERREYRAAANDEFMEKALLDRVDISKRNPAIENSNTNYPNNPNQMRQLRRRSLRVKDPSVVDCLNSILSSAVEYDLQLEPARLVNFVYFYCAYLQSAIPRSVCVKDNFVDFNIVPATFLQFIFDQTLLNETATYIASEEGEQITAPTALTN